MIKNIYISFLLLLILSAVHAQPLTSVPIYDLGRENSNPLFENSSNSFRLEEIQTIPFQENFYYFNDTSFYQKWDSSGVDLVVAATGPSRRIVRFNGVNYRNVNYSSTVTDTLVSKPILMANKDKSGRIYFGFYWQAGTGQATPDPIKGDKFAALIKRSDGSWDTVWKTPSNIGAALRYERIPVNKEEYFHDDFRIKFVRIEAPGQELSTWFLSNVSINSMLSVPFWDDFSNEDSIRSHFVTNTGVYINNNLCMNPPSFNVATFDGLDDYGSPYFNNTIYQMGAADSLVSKEFNLDSISGGISVKDSLYFSFYYQQAGLGEVPDSTDGDSLVLFFKDNVGRWRSVWHSAFAKTKDTTQFYQVLLKVTNKQFFHGNFRFKFLNYSRLSGPFDLWHVDYILMDTINSATAGRKILNGKVYTSDLAFSQISSSVSGPYRAVPNHHSDALSLDSLKYSYYNSTEGLNTAINVNYTFEAKSNGGTSNFSGTITNASLNPGINIVKIKADPNSLAPIGDTSFTLTTTATLTGEATTTTKYPYALNNIISTSTTFSNYYAYDDGTYERGVLLEQERAGLAVEFNVLKVDTLTAIDVAIPYIGYNLSPTKVYVKVWQDNNGKPGKELYSNIENVRYSPNRNGFTRYTINKKTVVVNGRFFVGYVQVLRNSNALRIGFDKNNNNADKYWYNNNMGDGWTQFRNLPGTPMIRPVFANRALNIVAKAAQEEEAFDMLLYPNPNADGTVRLNATFELLEIFDINMASKGKFAEADFINLQGLNKGVYFVQGYYKNKKYSKILVYQPN